MATSVHDGQSARLLEATRDQWHARTTAWGGRPPGSFVFTIFSDFTIFVFIVLPISQGLNVPPTAVATIFTLTLSIVLLGARGPGSSRRLAVFDWSRTGPARVYESRGACRAQATQP